jgi:hypothetical protein
MLKNDTDLYAWVTRYEMELCQVYDVDDLDDEVAVKALTELYGGRPIIAQLKVIHRTLCKLFHCRRRPAVSDALTLETTGYPGDAKPEPQTR